MGKIKRKGMSGEANRFISRNKAVRKLQINLPSFNRLCIIKGLFPIEPKNRMKAQKGDSKYRPLYLKKDIRFLMHDPLVWTIRDEMASQKKLRKARHKKDVSKEKILKRNKPIYRLDQNVLERYPTFIDAIKDLSDPLTMIFLFASLKSWKPVQEHHISRCQRLKMEFMTYVIESQSLSKAFISTRGYYYEAEILGQRVVWTVPHNCVTDIPHSVDMKIMVHFLEFNIAMLGFVNFRLLSKVNLRYPLKPAHIPRLTGPAKNDLDNFKNLMLSLNYPLERPEDKQTDEEGNDIDTHLIEGSTKRTQKAYTESLQSVERRKLFAGFKFFIGQENNRESLTMIVRACGGEVSWPSTMFPCSTYNVDDQCITHQIVDRPNFQKKHLSRYYVQPQWVYDSLNSITLQPYQSYFPDTPLPPHVCPFLKNYEGWYVPPEEETMRKLLEATPEEKEEILQQLVKDEQKRLSMIRAIDTENPSDDENDEDKDKGDEDDKDSDEDSDIDDEGSDEAEEEEKKIGNKKQKVKEITESAEVAESEGGEDENDDESEDDVSEDDHGMEVDGDDDDEENQEDGDANEERSAEAVAAPKKPEVRRGRELIINEKELQKKETKNEYNMRAFMIHKGNRKLYNKLRAKENRHEKKSTRLKERREDIELYKAGKLTKTQIDYPVKKVEKKTIDEKRKEKFKEKIKSAVKFAKSKANKNRDKHAVKPKPTSKV